MKRLLEAELIYGRLMTVTEPHLIGRYNKALKGFGLPETKLDPRYSEFVQIIGRKIGLLYI